MNRESYRRRSRIAIASISCAILAIFLEILFAFSVRNNWNCGILIDISLQLFTAAAILGFLAIVVITVRHKVLKGYVYAFLAILLSSPFLYLDYGIKCQAKVREQHKKEWSGLYNLELLGKELVKYAEDNGGRLPDANKWCDLLLEHNKNLTKENFKHPQPEIFGDIFDFKGEIQFAYNKNLSGMRFRDIPDDVVLLFEADGDWNLNGTGELLQTRYSEKGFIYMLFVDLTTANYWYYKEAIRKFGPKGTYMYYVKPRWSP